MGYMFGFRPNFCHSILLALHIFFTITSVQANLNTLTCRKLLNFRDASQDFLSVNGSFQYFDFDWDTRWEAFKCPDTFPALACLVRSDDQSCLGSTMCSYKKADVPIHRNQTGSGPGAKLGYKPRAIHYSHDQNLTAVNGKKVAPWYSLKSVSNNSFRLHSMTLAWTMPSDQEASVEAKTIAVRGFKNGQKLSDIAGDSIMFNVTDSLSSTADDKLSTEIPGQTFLPHLHAGMADLVHKFEFPNNGLSWGNLVALEISGYREQMSSIEDANDDSQVGEFYVKEIDISSNKFRGGCADEDEINNKQV